MKRLFTTPITLVVALVLTAGCSRSADRKPAAVPTAEDASEKGTNTIVAPTPKPPPP